MMLKKLIETSLLIYKKLKKMKKLILILATALSFSAVSAQNRNDDRYRDQYPATQTRDDWNNNDRDQRRDRDYGNNNRRYEQARRQAEYDRMNQQYNDRINRYRNDRSMDRYERQRRIEEAERERQQKSKSFGKGLIVGGLAALVIGAIISN